MYDDLSFINTVQRNFKTFQKMFQFQGWKRKNFIPGISAEGYQQKHELLQKRSTGKTKECSKHRQHTAIEKDIFLELNRCIFKYLLSIY